MEQKNRRFIVAAIILVIAGAMLASFGRNLFGLRTPAVGLPEPSDSSQGPEGAPPDADRLQPVEVTVQTVTGVVATLARPESYYRELTVETFWDGGSSATQVQVWSDGGWSHSIQTLPSRVIRHDLTGEGTLYYWYDGSRQYETAPADSRSSDLAQHIPTYETVLELEAGDISAAGYELRGELPCIFVEVRSPELNLTHRYWVSVDSGLLVGAETLEGEILCYRMSAYSPVQTPCPPEAEFILPDGTLLHQVDS